VTSSAVTSMLSSPLRSVSLSGERIVAITFQPCDWKCLAVALPMPEEAPVMSMVFAVESVIGTLLLG
jgi:hypothetical protein